jgi:hypothetical protein
VIVRKEDVSVDGLELIDLTLVNDRNFEGSVRSANLKDLHHTGSHYFTDEEEFPTATPSSMPTKAPIIGTAAPATPAPTTSAPLGYGFADGGP